MAIHWLCRVNRHKYVLLHNAEDERLSYLECMRCNKQRHWGLDLRESLNSFLERGGGSGGGI